MCLPEIYAFLCDVLGVISLTILVKILGFLAVNICIYNVQKIWSPSVRIPGELCARSTTTGLWK